MKNPMHTAANPMLRLVGKERDATILAMGEVERERTLRIQTEGLLATERAAHQTTLQLLEAERQARADAQAAATLAQQDLTTALTKPPIIIQPDTKADSAIARIEAKVDAIAVQPRVDLGPMEFEVRRGFDGKPNKIILKEAT